MPWRMIFVADWRDTPASELDKMIKFVNDSNADYFVAGGDYSGAGYSSSQVKSKINKTSYFIAGNHEGGSCTPTCVANKTYIANFNNKGVQVAFIGCGDGSECYNSPDTFDWTQIKDTSPALVFLHHNFIGSCGTHHLRYKDKIDALPTCITAACGHEHTYAEQFGSPGTDKTDRIYIQSGTPNGLRRCGPSGWLVGYWLFDDSVSGKLAVKYKKMSIYSGWSVPTSYDHTFTVNTTTTTTCDDPIFDVIIT